MTKIRDIKGERFGSLVAIEYVGSDKLGHALWLFECDCGNTKVNLSNKVLTGNTSTCGCRNGHGMRYTRMYRTWINMRVRCYDKNAANYKFYGARGIIVCTEWKNNFQCFYDWAMQNGYENHLTIDRINHRGPYSPQNCRWVTIGENVRNKVITQETRNNLSKARKAVCMRKKETSKYNAK